MPNIIGIFRIQLKNLIYNNYYKNKWKTFLLHSLLEVQLLLWLFLPLTVPHNTQTSLPPHSLKLKLNSSTSLLNTKDHTALRRNTNSDLAYSLRNSRKSWVTTQKRPVSSRSSTSSQTTPMLNSPEWREVNTTHQSSMVLNQLNSTIPKLSQTVLTGETQVLLPELRTKAHADHAGHSPPLVLLKVSTRSRLDHWSHSQSNNSLIAQPPTWVAMVDGHTKPWLTLPTHTPLKPKVITLTRERTVLALTVQQKAKLVSLDQATRPSLLTVLQLWPPLSANSQSQSSSKLINQSSNHTEVELSRRTVDVEPLLTTPSSWSDTETTELNTGS